MTLACRALAPHDPSTETPGQLSQSTSARLRSAELEIEGVREELTRQAATNEDLRATLAIRTRDLAASQQDLTRVERDLTRQLDETRHELEHALFNLTVERTRLNHAREERDYARAQLDDAIAQFSAEKGTA
jgi:uncharacterized protein YigA (DUF484 family)